MRLLVVILNYRSAPLTIQCLGTLAPEVEADPGIRVVVPDNASGDGSVDAIQATIVERGWEGWARVLPLDHNGGYAWGNNAAIRPMLASQDPPEHVMLLNPDTLVRPGAIGKLLAFMDSRPEVGIAGSRLEDEDGTQHASRYRFHTVWSELESGVRLGFVTRILENYKIMPPLTTVAHRTDWVAGASMIVRRQVLEEIGLLDERFFLYFEETDFCLRASRAGWPCWYVPDSRVAHIVGQSSGVTRTREKGIRRPAYWFESRAHYFRKNHGRAYAFLCDVAWTVGFGSWRIRRRLQRRPDLDPPHLWWDFVRYSFLGARGLGAPSR